MISSHPDHIPTRDPLTHIRPSRGRPSRGRTELNRRLGLASAVWMGVALVIAMIGIRSVDRDARLLVSAAIAVGVGSAGLASWMLSRGRSRLAGVLLIVSAVTPHGPPHG